ncbi:MAG: carbohydrate binding family 9 domain-containing protein [Saprospiraceae bacterium]|nr:carbohydrate binding family 9 domain-containing protein [Saprospiraceae bacterium]
MIFRFCFIALYLFGIASVTASDSPQKKIKALKITENIKIDGFLREESWSNAEKAFGFIQREPVVGKDASFESEVYFVYDNTSIYIGARLHDPEPDKILRELSIRDQIGNADNFSVFLDAYKSGLNGFLFTVTASGVQAEYVVTNHVEDPNWNAVWDSAVRVHESGWDIEIRIPFASLRFPTDLIQDWNIQFGREIRRFRESSHWSAIDPLINGWVQQSGTVEQLQDIVSPVRLSLTPYVSGYLNTVHKPGSGNQTSASSAYSAGLDMKYGINDAFTLDMTLIPDFGQVISDRQVLNLTPFEVFFEENRQFFTEGTELFNKGSLFYSRRIGGTPLHFNKVNSQLNDNEFVKNNPDVTQLYNATKVSGRTSGGTGVGVFNAIVGETFATISDNGGIERNIKTNPLTNYNAIVIDRNLKNNSFISFMNTNVLREGADYDANVTGGFFNFKTRDQKWFTEGNISVSQKIYTDFKDIGYTYNLNLGKASGKWTYNILHGVESENYNPNDMGFLFSPNSKFYSASGSYTEYNPKKPELQQYRFSGSINYSRLFKPDVFNDFSIEFSNFILWKSRNAIGFNARIEPVRTFDYFEPRTSDFRKALAWTENYSIGGFISSDYRKPFALDINTNYRYFNSPDRYNITLRIGPRFRFSDKFSLFQNLNISSIRKEPGYINKLFADTFIPDLQTEDILMGVRDRLIIDNSITARYIFNNLMGINLRVRHYWDQVIYTSFGALTEKGDLSKLTYSGNNTDGKPIFDRNVNIFNIDLQYSWRFAPGSDIIFVWKNQILNSDENYARNYLQNLTGLFDSLQSNSISLRFLYFLDYQQIVARKV